MFTIGVLAPVVAVTLLLIGGPNQAVVPSPEVLRAQPTYAALEPILLPDIARRQSPDRGEPVAQGAAEMPAEPIVPARLELIVNRGDSLDSLFRRNGLDVSDLALMLKLPEAAAHLRRILPGDELTIVHDGRSVVSLERAIRDDALLNITRTPSGFEASEIERDIETRVVGRYGVVKSSLFEAGTAAQIPDRIIMAMAGIFQWDIDFILDPRVDDRFTVLYEERWREGERIGFGRILATEYVNRGEAFRAVLYTDPDGRTDHYTPDGRSVRKAFVRAPLNFTRVSSNFNPNRRHPVLNTIRAHRGVDYAAPAGTPVFAAGDGKIIQRGPNGGYGNAVVIQHGDNITTLYGHLSRFAKQRVGSRVSQHEVIGYVGQTGLATGPHLHYEYRVNGVHRNPRTVALPNAEPVPEKFRTNFEQETAMLWRQLDAFQSAWVARVSN
jgi:murein DD-endopeptidase MepM/ murein hydrolase activator NlpD